MNFIDRIKKTLELMDEQRQRAFEAGTETGLLISRQIKEIEKEFMASFTIKGEQI